MDIDARHVIIPFAASKPRKSSNEDSRKIKGFVDCLGFLDFDCKEAVVFVEVKKDSKDREKALNQALCYLSYAVCNVEASTQKPCGGIYWIITVCGDSLDLYGVALRVLQTDGKGAVILPPGVQRWKGCNAPALDSGNPPSCNVEVYGLTHISTILLHQNNHDKLSKLFAGLHRGISCAINIKTSTKKPLLPYHYMPWTNDYSARDFFFKPLHPGTEHNVFTAQMVPSSPSSAPHEVYVYKFVSANESRACNIEAIRTAWGSEQFDLRKVAVFTLPRNHQVLRHVYIDGSHKVTAPRQLQSVVEQLMRLHMDGYVHGDVRLPNMLFTEDACEPFGYLIDFDFCRKADADTPMYLPSYNTQGIPERHRDAMANMPMRIEHDVHSMIWICNHVYSSIKEVHDLASLLEALKSLSH